MAAISCTENNKTTIQRRNNKIKIKKRGQVVEDKKDTGCCNTLLVNKVAKRYKI